MSNFKKYITPELVERLIAEFPQQPILKYIYQLIADKEEHKENYSLYRVFDVMNPKKTPGFYETTGYVGDNFTLNSNKYIALRDIVDVVDVK